MRGNYDSLGAEPINDEESLGHMSYTGTTLPDPYGDDERPPSFGQRYGRLILALLVFVCIATVLLVFLLPHKHYPITIIISFDGFRARYLHQDHNLNLPNLRTLQGRGLYAKYMWPSY
eukprot:GABV01011737.1.p1 GENE.GABV01011737.1~~GABV01011737.1.p1  ORF type:complete len:118 (-),score=10.53 GABV01011737.1:11-364(-)